MCCMVLAVSLLVFDYPVSGLEKGEKDSYPHTGSTSSNENEVEITRRGELDNLLGITANTGSNEPNLNSGGNTTGGDVQTGDLRFDLSLSPITGGINLGTTKDIVPPRYTKPKTATSTSLPAQRKVSLQDFGPLPYLFLVCLVVVAGLTWKIWPRIFEFLYFGQWR